MSRRKKDWGKKDWGETWWGEGRCIRHHWKVSDYGPKPVRCDELVWPPEDSRDPLDYMCPDCQRDTLYNTYDKPSDPLACTICRGHLIPDVSDFPHYWCSECYNKFIKSKGGEKKRKPLLPHVSDWVRAEYRRRKRWEAQQKKKPLDTHSLDKLRDKEGKPPRRYYEEISGLAVGDGLIAHEEVIRARNRLPPELQNWFSWYFYDQDDRSIAEALGLSERTVRRDRLKFDEALRIATLDEFYMIYEDDGLTDVSQ